MFVVFIYRICRFYIRLDPDFVRFWELQPGDALLRHQACRQAAALSPKMAEAVYNEVWVLDEQGQSRKAASALSTWIQLMFRKDLRSR